MIHGKPMTLTGDDLNKVVGALEYMLPDREEDIEITPDHLGPQSHGAPGLAVRLPEYARPYFFRLAYEHLGETSARNLANKARLEPQGANIILYFPGVTLTDAPVNA